MKPRERIAKALGVIAEDAWYDGEDHKQWVLDQVVRALTTGAEYHQWLKDLGGEWEEGTAP